MYLGTAGFVACIVSGSIVSLLTGGQDPTKLPKNVLFPIIDRQFKRTVPDNPYHDETHEDHENHEEKDGKENEAYDESNEL